MNRENPYKKPESEISVKAGGVKLRAYRLPFLLIITLSSASTLLRGIYSISFLYLVCGR